MAGIVMLSGGLDSTVALALFNESNTIDLAITFDYGQRAAAKEISAAEKIAKYYNIEHEIVKLPFLKKQTFTALVNNQKELPEITIEELDDKKKSTNSAQNVWVPNRNGLFINIAAVYAENRKNEPVYIITGFNKEEGETFPDNSVEFINSINDTLRYSTLKDIRVISPTSYMKKEDIVKKGLSLGVPFEKIWSCYNESDFFCGVCESCLRFKRALLANGQEKLINKMFKIN